MELFFQLIHVSTGRRSRLSQTPSAQQWNELLDMSIRQSLVGVCGIGIERLPEEQRPPRNIAMRWAFLVSKIEQRNLWMNKKCGELTDLFDYDGLSSCVLKGQGIATLYPYPLRRQSGDIDILCWPKGSSASHWHTDETVKYVRNHSNTCKIVYHHAEMNIAIGRSSDGMVTYVPIRDGNCIEVEVHYRPSWFYSPIRNRRLQKWLLSRRKNIERSPDGTFYIPDIEFNTIYILTHIFRHLFDEGIGLRQLLDYHYVLTALGRTEYPTGEIRNSLKYLGLHRFCGAVMYVLHEVFGLEKRYMIVPMNTHEGRFLLKEIMQAGNFGMYDERSRPKYGEDIITRFIRRQRRISRFLIHYPEETLSAPLWTVWHWLWRKHKGYNTAR